MKIIMSNATTQDEASAWEYANALAGKGVYVEVHQEGIKMKNYKILDVELDMEGFGGVLAIINVDGRKILIGEQLRQDGDEVRREGSWDSFHDCWKFINGGAIDDDTAQITEICDDEDRAWDIFEAAIDEAVEMANKGLATGIMLAYQSR